MIDSEVSRLRRLRNTALSVRAVAKGITSDNEREAASLARLSQIAWTIARTVSGRLIGHPHLSFQQPPGAMRLAYIELAGYLQSSWASHRARGQSAAIAALQRLTRELDDARSLTWSGDLSDAFGRSQHQLRRLLAELDRSPPRIAMQGSAVASENWPYLAF